MTYTLFLNEKKIIWNIGTNALGIGNISTSVAPTQVFHGHFTGAKINQKQEFNLGFEFLFYGDRNFSSITTRGMAVSILPQTLGAEVFFSCDASTMEPVYLTFMDSGAFPIKFFTHYIEEIETAIQETVISCNEWLPCEEQFAESYHSSELTSAQLIKRLHLKNHRYLRVMVIYDDICFLSFPKHELPIHQGTRYRIAKADDRCIDCCVDGDGIVCIDGWLKTIRPKENEWKLIATYE